jgi:ankyrin repeat protein
LELAVSKTLEEKEHNVKFQEAIEKDDKCQEEVTETEKTDDLLQCNICKRTFGYKEPILNCVECCTDDNGHNYRLQSKEGEDSNYDNPYNACENCIPGPKCPKEIGKGTHILLRYPGIRARPRLIRTLLISDPEVVRAVKSADVTALRLCSKNKQALNIRTNGGKTPLHLAVQYGLEEIVTILLEMGAEFDTMDDDKLTPFTTAMLYGYSSIVNTLIQYGVDINGHSSTKDGPYLHTAAMNGDPEILKVILQNKPFLDVVYDDVVALNLAMRHNLEFVKLLLEAGADVNIRKPTADARLLTPIYYAAFRKRKDIVKLLIQYGALLDVDDLEGETPLGLAVRMKALSACRILLEAGANINQGHLKTKCPLLVTACRTREQDDLIQLLLQYKPKIDATTEEGLTALAMAAGLNSVAVCQMLLDAGANIDIVTAAGNSPLMVAVIHGELENTKFLIQRNAKVNVQEKNGYSALSIAAFYGKLDFLQVIVDAGAVSRPPTPCTKWKYFRFHETVSRSTKLRVLEIVRGAKHK